MPETTRTDRCATCGAEVVYVTTASQGLWHHTVPLREHHPPEPLKFLTGGRLADELREARRVAHHLSLHHDDCDAYGAAVARAAMFEQERDRRASVTD